MKLQKATVVIAAAFGWGVVVAQAEVKHTPDKKIQSNSPVVSRDKKGASTAPGWKASYKEIIDPLAAKNAGKPIVQWCGTASLAEGDKVEELKEHFDTVYKYREALNSCKDNLHGKLKGFFDDYVAKMKLESKDASSLSETEKAAKSLQGMDSALRFHEHIKKFLDEKASALKSSKDDFAKADQKLVEALDGIYNLCVAKEFQPSDDAETTQKIDEFNNQVEKLGIKKEYACKLALDAPGAPVPDEEQSADSGDGEGSESSEESGSGPGSAQGSPAGQGDPSAGSGAIGGVGAQQQSAVLPFSGGVNVPFQGLSAGSLQDNLDNQLQQDLDERRQLVDTLRQAARDATRPNRVGGSPDNSRSFQFPPVSVQPQPQQPQNPNQQQQYPPQTQYPPFPMMQQPVPTPIPAELLNANRNADSARPNPNVAAQAAQTQSLMEMARLQQQLMQAQMANQQMGFNPYNQNGATSNINRLRRGRTAFRGARGSAGTRFMSKGIRTNRTAR